MGNRVMNSKLALKHCMGALMDVSSHLIGPVLIDFVFSCLQIEAGSCFC